MSLLNKGYSAIHSLAYQAYLRLDSFVNSRWYADPYGTQPHASIEDYLALAEGVKGITPSAIREYEADIGFAIDQIWLDELALHTQIVKKTSPLSYIHGRIVYSALRDYLEKNQPTRINIIETGTARGFSALCMARALQDSKAGGSLRPLT